MSILENNKLIADFMSIEVHVFQWNDRQSLVLGSRDDFNFRYMQHYEPDKDWNILMSVVEKIENFNDGDTLCIIEDERCHINTQNGFEIDSVGHTKIEATYNGVVEFIKWYNSNKDNNG